MGPLGRAISLAPVNRWHRLSPRSKEVLRTEERDITRFVPQLTTFLGMAAQLWPLLRPFGVFIR